MAAAECAVSQPGVHRAACTRPVCDSRESGSVPRRDVPLLPSNSYRTQGSSPSGRPGPHRSSRASAVSCASGANGTAPNRTPPSPSPTASADHRTHGTTAAPSHRPQPGPASAGVPRPCHADTVRSENRGGDSTARLATIRVIAPPRPAVLAPEAFGGTSILGNAESANGGACVPELDIRLAARAAPAACPAVVGIVAAV